MEHGIAAGVQVRDHAVLCPLRVMAADGVDDTLVFHAALGAVLIVRHRDHNADRRGDDGHRPARPVAAPAWAERRRARRHAGPAAAVRAVAGRGAGRVNGGS